MQWVTLTPIRSHLNLKLGVNEQSKGYDAFLASMASVDARLNVQKFRDKKAYRLIDDDDRNTLLLFRLSHTYPEQSATVEAQVYGNTLTVVSVTFDWPDVDYDEALEARLQSQTTALIDRFYQEQLYPLLLQLPNHVKPAYLQPVGAFSGFHDLNSSTGEQGVEQLWTACLLRLPRSQVTKQQATLKHWLKDTRRPEDAEDIVRGECSYSMSWLHYVVVDEPGQSSDFRLDAMCLAQYIYSVQDVCNAHLNGALSQAFLEDNPSDAEHTLETVRAATRLHSCAYQDALKYLRRDKKQLVEEILAVWDFDRLTKNSQELIDICSSRISDIHTERSEKSTFYTDLILVAIGFISLFDLAISLSEYSRSYMASATLGYRDDVPSGFLSMVAAWQTDNLLAMSGVSIVVLLLGYWYVKRR